jgi:uncharacterized protein YdeI (YjbR/CyaY-like superfamily)
MAQASRPLFFESAAEFRDWLDRHHDHAKEVVVGFYKVGTKQATLSWSDAVDEALCVGWIDGLRRAVDEQRYQIRFTPRRPGSNWSALNIRKAKALIQAGRMKPAGLAAWDARAQSSPYSYEQTFEDSFAKSEEKALRSNKAAWKDWETRAPSYRKSATRWVTSAKRPQTRKSRLETLIRCCAAGAVIPPLRYGRHK